MLADFAVPVEDFDRAVLAGQIKELEEDVADAAEGARARPRRRSRLDQLKRARCSAVARHARCD